MPGLKSNTFCLTVDLIFLCIPAHAQFDIIYDTQGSMRNMIYKNANRDMARHDKEMREADDRNPVKNKKSNPVLKTF